MALTKVSYSMITGAVYNALDYGISTSAVNNVSAIDALITTVSAAGGGTIYFPAGTYNIQSAITLRSNVAFKGDGRTSIIKAKAGNFYMFNAATYAADNVTFDGLTFDGSDNYPTNTITTNPRTYANRNVAIRVGGVSANNLRIVNCYFYKLSGGAIDVLRDGVSNILIQNNELRDANYCQWAICVRCSTSPPTLSTRPTQILIDGNIIYGGGPESWYDPSIESWGGSTDAIIVDKCQNFVISNNLIHRNSSIGIRVEESVWGVVSNNEIYNAGQHGIACYKQSYYISITGNTIKAWGRIPIAYCIRNYSGSYVYPKEFPNAVYAPLPADPTLSSWFAVWPYDLTNVDTTKIITYSASDYYTGSSGMLPFRGYAAITVNFESASCVVSGNICIGDTTQVGGKYVYASDFGYSNVHPVNSSTISNSGNETQVVGNYFGDVRQYGIYAPVYQDPINTVGIMGIGQYNGNYGASEGIAIFNGNGRFSSLYLTPNMLVTSGSVAPTTGSYTRGSIVYNTAPSAGGNIGWVCVTAGSPGTWKTFGSIAP